MIKNWSIVDILKLSFFKGVGDNITYEIINNYDSFDDFQNAKLPAKLNLIFNQGELFKSNQQKPEFEAEKQLEICEKNNYKIVSFWDDDYPYLLKQIYLPPPILFVRGQLQASDKDCISIVGTRRNSSYGKIQAERFAEYFAQRGVIVASGMAFGIDCIAHQAVIKSGGTTYAVIASGLDCIKPPVAQKLSDAIVDSGGAILSTFKCQTIAFPPLFLQRNRIISGLSRAVIVIESKIQGGSLNTARFARDQNRETFALPGNVSSETSAGTNNLIAESLAKVALSPEYIYSDLSFSNQQNISINDIKKIEFESESEEKIYNTLSQEPIHIDEIINLTELETSVVMVDLLNLEFRNLIRQTTGKLYYKI